MHEIPRHLVKMFKESDDFLSKNKTLTFVGPTGAGKSHIINLILKRFKSSEILRLSGNDMIARILLMNNDKKALIDACDGFSAVFIDRSHRIERVEKSVEIIRKAFPEMTIILSSSIHPEKMKSGFIRVYPVAISELRGLHRSVAAKDFLEEVLVFGSLPDVIAEETFPNKKTKIREIVNFEILKDVFDAETIANSNALLNMLNYLAINLCVPVSISRLATEIGVNQRTAMRYIEILKKHYIIHEHISFCGTKKRSYMSKYYFYDNGVRNSLINNLNRLKVRNDSEQLWENYLIIERHKIQELRGISHSDDVDSQFWKIPNSKTINLLELGIGKSNYGVKAFNFSYKRAVSKNIPTTLKKKFPKATFEIIHPDNFDSFIDSNYTYNKPGAGENDYVI